MSTPATEEYVTLILTDDEGRRLTRTMRRRDQLKVLMDFYYSMVPTVEYGKGVFNYRGPPINRAGDKTPADFMMKDGDVVRFFPEIELVTPVLRDFTGRSLTRTMRTTDRLQVIMDFYHAMVPAAALAPGAFLYCGERVTGEQTPAGLGMKDWDRIYVVPTVRGEVGDEKQSDDYITLKVADFFEDNLDKHMVHLTMRRTEKVIVLINFYYATLPAVRAQGGVFMLDAIEPSKTRLSGQETPAQLGLEEGYKVTHCVTL